MSPLSEIVKFESILTHVPTSEDADDPPLELVDESLSHELKRPMPSRAKLGIIKCDFLIGWFSWKLKNVVSIDS